MLAYILNRDEFDTLDRAKFECRYSGDELETEWARRYPKGIDDAIRELHARGLKCSETLLLALARQRGPVRQIGRSIVFYASDIDAIAEALADREDLTMDALYRRTDGVTAATWVKHSIELYRRLAREITNA